MKVLVTGGAGHIGSLLTGVLLADGHQVTVIDDLRFGGETLLGYWYHPGFRLVRADLTSQAAAWPQALAGIDAVVHLAAIVGYPACEAAGRDAVWQANVEATERVLLAAERAGVARFVFASTCSNYGIAQGGQPVTEGSPLHALSLYAESKIAAEKIVLDHASSGRCSPTVLRFATLFGLSPRPRFDLIINQFVAEALKQHRLEVYRGGDARSFVHVRDVCKAIELVLGAAVEQVRGHVFNVGSDDANFTKDEIVQLVQRHVPGTVVERQEAVATADIRDYRVAFGKIRGGLGFVPGITVEEGICELRDALSGGVIVDANGERYRNAMPITP